MSRLHNKILNANTRAEIPKDAGDFRLLTRRVVEAMNSLGERERYMKGLYSWVGFEYIGLPYTPRSRLEGETKWSPFRLIELSVSGIVSFSTAPIRGITIVGFVVAMISVIYGAWIVLEKIIFGNNVAGFPALAVMISFIGAIQLISIGIIGEYVAQLVSEAKRRPLYIVKKKWHIKPNARDTEGDVIAYRR